MTISLGSVWTYADNDDGTGTSIISGTATTAGSTLLLFINSYNGTNGVGAAIIPSGSGFTILSSLPGVGQPPGWYLYKQSSGSVGAIKITWYDAFGNPTNHFGAWTATMVEIKSTQGTFSLDGTVPLATSFTPGSPVSGALTTSNASSSHNTICVGFLGGTHAPISTVTFSAPTNSYAIVTGSAVTVDDSNGVGSVESCAVYKIISTNVSAETASVTPSRPIHPISVLDGWNEGAGTFVGRLKLYAVDYGMGESCGPFFRNPLG